MSLERHVAAIIGNGMVTRESPLSIAHHAVALVREQIAHDIEAERDAAHWSATFRNGMDHAAVVACGGRS